MLKVFAKPGWVITAVAVIAFAYLAFTVLAPWQLGKNARTSERNHNIEMAFEKAPQPVGDVFAADGSLKVNEWTRVELRGHYVPDAQVLVRMRPIDGQQAYQSLLPFRSDSGQVLMVNRGFVPATPNVAPVVPQPPSGEVSVVGFARASEQVPSNPPVQRDGFTQVSGISTEEVSGLTGMDLGRDYVQLAQDQPGGLTAIPLPQLEPGPYLSYGIQWIAFGIMAPLGLLYFIRAELKERREDELLAQQASTAADAAPAAEGAVPTQESAAQASEASDGAADESAAVSKAQAPSEDSRQAPPRRRARYGGRQDHFRHISDDQQRF
ncbi:hypothetical protein CAQU_08820 [Corynebacterium aquilae DSM 44791]|uniref:SURF1-like protein n=1 Tax=Corynebacterium aquilae DSM 44791 TaxID=1431546 RepID=A0A1L7CH26_9CORY|nr:hypothetical protein CAQU_08820 [Corynebacterium aquilae DSM 44791]